MATLVGRPSAAETRGHVVFATAGRLYLDAGAADGLALAQALAIHRRQQTVGRCAIDTLADHNASCPGTFGRGGDTFTIAAAKPRVFRPSANAPSLPSADLLVRADRALAQEQQKVDFSGDTAAPAARLVPASATLSDRFWTRFDGRNFHEERLDLSLDGQALGFGGFRAWAMASLAVWTQRPKDVRYRPDAPVQLYVWQAEVSSRELGRPFTAAFGRIWPEHTPGLGVIDGAQAGWRSHDGRVEIGAVGGGVPDALTLIPTFGRWTAGVFYSHSLAQDADSTLRIWRHELEVGVMSDPVNGPGMVAAANLQASFLKALDLSAMGQLFYRPGQTLTLSIGQAHIVARPYDRLNLSLAFNYLGATIDDDQLGLPNARRVRAAFDGQWLARSWFSLGFTSGVGHDLDLGETREWVGPEVTFPTTLGGFGGIGLGYREELGDTAGRSAYLQLSSNLARWRILLRGSYTHDQWMTSTNPSALDEVGGFVSLDLRVSRWMAVRASALLRGALGVVPVSPRVPPLGLSTNAGVAGFF